MLNIYIIIAEALVMLFELRFLLQSSSADYYHPFTQAILKLTNPIVNISFIRSMHVRQFFVGGLLVSFVISIIFWLAFGSWIRLPLEYNLLLGLLMPIKVFGYLIFMLLIVQALTSWLPSTRHVSYYCYQLTAPLVVPVQKIIPPIGMIDISLMIVLIAMYAINSLFYRLFGMLWAIL